MQDRFPRANTQLLQFGNSGAWVAPLLPVATAKTSADPLIQLAEEAAVGHETEIAHPSLKILAKFLAAARDGHASFAAGRLAYAVFELLDILRADVGLAAVALEDVAEEFDSIGVTDAALLLIHHQLEFSREVSPH